MASYFAQALLSRVQDTELTVSCASATVASIALTRFDDSELTAQQKLRSTRVEKRFLAAHYSIAYRTELLTYMTHGAVRTRTRQADL